MWIQLQSINTRHAHKRFEISADIKFSVVSLSCLDELDITVGTGILFQAADQEIELAPYMTVVQ